MNKYESIIIIRPTLNQDEINKLLNKYKEQFESLSNKPVAVEDLGKKKLAYEVQGNSEGNYATFNFYANSQDFIDIERNYRLDDNILKFINVRQDPEYEEDYEEESVEEEIDTEDDNMEFE